MDKTTDWHAQKRLAEHGPSTFCENPNKNPNKKKADNLPSDHLCCYRGPKLAQNSGTQESATRKGTPSP